MTDPIQEEQEKTAKILVEETKRNLEIQRKENELADK